MWIFIKNPESSNLIGWKLEVGMTSIYSAWQGLCLWWVLTMFWSWSKKDILVDTPYLELWQKHEEEITILISIPSLLFTWYDRMMFLWWLDIIRLITDTDIHRRYSHSYWEESMLPNSLLPDWFSRLQINVTRYEWNTIEWAVKFQNIITTWTKCLFWSVNRDKICVFTRNIEKNVYALYLLWFPPLIWSFIPMGITILN